jgi:exodeoxyribonuclease VII large subunit
MNPQPKNSAISVTELTQKIDQLLTYGIGDVRVSGEVFNFKAAQSGHRYFTLKDEGAQISCVFWKGRPVSVKIADGMRVIVEGRLTVYPPQGKYQIDCRLVTQQGKGDLYLAFEALKLELAARGYFDAARKKRLPSLPWRIGVVTSPNGAAIEDIKSTLKRRMPACAIYFCPASVQGENAPGEIAGAIRTLNQTDCEVMIVGRGGGSLEDLWAFNTRTVAQAIYESRIPVVSAVGHEIDFTIADFVADVRAATPTAAAELVTKRDKLELLGVIAEKQGKLSRRMSDILQKRKQAVAALSNSYALQRFPERLHNYTQRVDEAEERMEQSAGRILGSAQQRVSALSAHLESLHPLSPLRRGFALLRSESRLIAAGESLEGLESVEIVRQGEVARVKIERVSRVE